MRNILAGIGLLGGVIAGIVLIVAVIFAVLGFRVITAGLFGAGEAHIRTQSADFRLTAYQRFFDQCASIQGLEGTIDELTAQLDMLEPTGRSHDLAVTSLTGTKSLRHQAIATYNQDALKWTVGQFRGSDLPYQLLDSNYPAQRGKTICAVR